MFHANRLGLQPFHLSKLIQGDTIRIKNAQFTGPVVVHLTKVQWNKLRKVRANGTGMTLKMSSTQVRHNIQHGEGLWDTITRIYNRVAPVFNAIVPVAKAGYNAYNYFKGVLSRTMSKPSMRSANLVPDHLPLLSQNLRQSTMC